MSDQFVIVRCIEDECDPGTPVAVIGPFDTEEAARAEIPNLPVGHTIVSSFNYRVWYLESVESARRR